MLLSHCVVNTHGREDLLACIAAIPRLDAKEGNLRPVSGILLPLASAALCLWAGSQSRIDEWKAFVAFLLAGGLLYLVARRGRTA